MNPRLVPPSRLARLSLRMQGDERLAELAGLGSEAAFEAIVHRYRRALLAHCAQVVGESDADEAVQEALLKAHRALAGGTPVHSLGPWLHAIAHNSALAMLAGRRAGAEYREDDVAGRHSRAGSSRATRRARGRDAVAAGAPAPGARDAGVRGQELRRDRHSARRQQRRRAPVAEPRPNVDPRAARRADPGRSGPAVDDDHRVIGPSRARTLAGSGALAAKLSGAVLMSAAPVVADREHEPAGDPAGGRVSD